VIPPLDIQELPPNAQKMLDEAANPKMRLAAARGIVPGLKPAEIVTLLVAFAEGPSSEVSSTARQTLSGLPPPMLKGAV
jgi:hypothetical protein